MNIAVQMGSAVPLCGKPCEDWLVRAGIIIPNSGARLAAPTAKRSRILFWYEISLKPWLSGLLPERIGDRHLRRLEAMIEEGRAIEEKDLEKYLEVNEAFHKAIADASGNRVLAEYVKTYLPELMPILFSMTPSISLKQCQVLMPTGKSLWLCDIMMQKSVSSCGDISGSYYGFAQSERRSIDL